MAKKRLSRLEFYGYRDQNHYTTFYDCGSGANQRQDEAIEKILDVIEGIDDDVEAISGAVATITEELDGIGADIAGLSAVTEGHETQLSAMTDDLADMSSKVDSLDTKVNEQDVRVANVEESVAANTSSIEDINTKLSDILGRDYTTLSEVDAIYAKKDDVYTKAECDEKFLTEHQSLSGYVTNEQLDAAIQDIEAGSSSAMSGLTDRIEAIEEHNDEQDLHIAELGNSFDEAIGIINEKIAAINNKDGEQDAAIAEKALQGDLTALSGVVGTMATQDSLNALQQALEAISYTLETKESKDNVTLLKNALESADNALDGRLRAVEEGLSGVTANDLPMIRQDISDLKTSSRDAALDIQALRNAIEQEKIDRDNGDKALLGKTTDTVDSKTIYGVRKYAESVANERANAKAEAALREANEYTDSKVNELNQTLSDEIDGVKNDFESKLILKADTSAVTASLNSIRDEVVVALDDTERQLKAYTDGQLEDVRESSSAYTDNRYTDLSQQLAAVNTELSDLTRVVQALADEVHCKFNTIASQLLGYDININYSGCDESNASDMH